MLGVGWNKNGLHKGDNRWMQMTSTNGLPLMKTSNSHLGWINKKGSTLKAKPNEIGLRLLIAMWFRSKPNIGVRSSPNLNLD